MNIKAAPNTLAVEPVKLGDLVKGGVFAVAEKQPEAGKVVDIGYPKNDDDQVFYEEFGVQVGDIVLYRKYGSTNFFVDGKTYAFVGIEDVVGKLCSQ